MELHPTRIDPTPGALLVCRNVRWNIALLLAVFWAVPIGAWCIGAPALVVGFCAVLPALLSWPLVSAWRKRGRADNWVMTVHRSGVWLNLRVAEYHEAEPGRTVVFLPFEEIVSGRRVVHRYTTPSGDNDTTQHSDVYLELKLSPAAVAELKTEIVAERKRNLPERRHLGGMVTTRSGRTHSMVEVEGEDAIRIKFRTSTGALRPSIKRALEQLRTLIAIEDDDKPAVVNWRELEGKDLDDMLRRLVANGQSIAAMNLLRRRKLLSTTEAKQYVEALRGG